MPPTKRRLRALALSAALLSTSTMFSLTALAEPTPEERALARSLFEQGRALMKDEKFTEACPKLEESQRLDPGIGTVFNLGDCLEKLGRNASAWAAFSDAADLAKRAGQAERETVARDRANALAPKLARVKIRMNPPTPAGLELQIDGRSVGAAVLDTETPIDPGEHRIRATAPGKQPKDTSVTIAPTATVAVVDLGNLDDVPVETPPAPIGPPVQEERQERARTWQKPLAIGTGVVGVVALGLGSVFGLQASSTWSDGEKLCPNDVCTSEGKTKWDDARSSATASTITFVVGGVLVATAIVLFVTSPTERRAATSAMLGRRP